MNATEWMDDPRFNLDEYRDMDARIDMVNLTDCPLAVRRIVAEHDQDQEVLLALWKLKLNDPQIDEFLNKNMETSPADLDKAQTEAENAQVHKVWCSLPWTHASTNADGSIRMCCQMIHDNKQAPYGSVFKEDGSVLTADDDLRKHRNAEAWKDVRAKMIAGVDPEICKLCTLEENNGIGSKRTFTKKIHANTFKRSLELTQEDGTIKDEDFPISYYDLRFGNKCNLKCRSCGPTDSNLWYGDWYEAHKEEGSKFAMRGHDTLAIVKNDDGSYDVPDVFDWHEENNTTLWDNINEDMSKGVIDRFYFTGGEPTINLKHRELLDKAIEFDVAKNISLEYNTNMAGIPSKVFTQWKQFKNVGIGMSLDGMYEHFEYIRHPGKWSVVEKNIRRIESEPGFEKVTAAISLTLSTMNVLHVLDMQWWAREQRWSRISQAIKIANLYGPAYMNIQNLPPEAKKYIGERYEQFIAAMHRRWNDSRKDISIGFTIEQRLRAVLDHMNAVDQDPKAWKNWYVETEKYDKLRNEDWKETFPEIVELIKVANDRQARKQKVKLTSAGKKK